MSTTEFVYGSPPSLLIPGLMRRPRANPERYERLFRLVPEAAKELDRLHPGWHSFVDPSTLDMSCPVNCVLGQVGANMVDLQEDFAFTIMYREFMDQTALKWTDGLFSSNIILGEWQEEILARRVRWQDELDAMEFDTAGRPTALPA